MAGECSGGESQERVLSGYGLTGASNARGEGRTGGSPP